MCEARDASGSVVSQYFSNGQTISGSNYYYTKDLLGSIREVTDNGGAVQVVYSYDPYGRVTQLQGTLASDFQYAGYYIHSPSGLNLAEYRVYNPKLARWLSRDPIVEEEPQGKPGRVELASTLLSSLLYQGSVSWSQRLPNLTRLISASALGARSPISGRVQKQSVANLYSYVGNRPLKYADPTGLQGQGQGGDDTSAGNDNSCPTPEQQQAQDAGEQDVRKLMGFFLGLGLLILLLIILWAIFGPK